MTNYSSGDVANGHVLGTNGWHRLATVPQKPPQVSGAGPAAPSARPWVDERLAPTRAAHANKNRQAATVIGIVAFVLFSITFGVVAAVPADVTMWHIAPVTLLAFASIVGLVGSLIGGLIGGIVALRKWLTESKVHD